MKKRIAKKRAQTPTETLASLRDQILARVDSLCTSFRKVEADVTWMRHTIRDKEEVLNNPTQKAERNRQFFGLSSLSFPEAQEAQRAERVESFNLDPSTLGRFRPERNCYEMVLGRNCNMEYHPKTGLVIIGEDLHMSDSPTRLRSPEQVLGLMRWLEAVMAHMMVNK